MEYFINDLLKKVYKPGELEDPYKKEVMKLKRKKLISLEEYARFTFLDGCRGFWDVNMNQKTDQIWFDAQESLRSKIAPEEAGDGTYRNWPGLLAWCRCFVISRCGYETAALNHIATLSSCFREDAVLRLWGADLKSIKNAMRGAGVDVEKYNDLWQLPGGLNYGFYLGDYDLKKHKIETLTYAKNSIIAMIRFLRLADVFLDMLGKALNFDPAAFKTNAQAWNRIIIGLGGVFSYPQLFLFQNIPAGILPPMETEDLKETRELWRGIVDEIWEAVNHEWTAQELKPLKERLKRNPFGFYESPTDVDFILKVFGAEKDY